VRGIRDRARQWGERVGARYPTASAALLAVSFVAATALPVAAIERHWSRVDQPALWVIPGVVTSLALLGLWFWIWRGGFTAPTWLNVPVWILPGAAVAVALRPRGASESVSLLANAFLVPHLLGCAVFFVVGAVASREHTADERLRRGRRAFRWLNR
jgi:hypothetical protein